MGDERRGPTGRGSAAVHPLPLGPCRPPLSARVVHEPSDRELKAKAMRQAEPYLQGPGARRQGVGPGMRPRAGVQVAGARGLGGSCYSHVQWPEDSEQGLRGSHVQGRRQLFKGSHMQRPGACLGLPRSLHPPDQPFAAAAHLSLAACAMQSWPVSTDTCFIAL